MKHESQLKDGQWNAVVIITLHCIMMEGLSTVLIMTFTLRIHRKIEQLEKKVEKHNQVIDRVYKLEQSDAVENEEIKVINHRIADLEQYHK